MQEKLASARLTLLFTPELCRLPPMEVIEACLPWVDIVQVRIKHPDNPDWASPALELFRWTRAVLEVVPDIGAGGALVIVNDRVDVAVHLEQAGVAGVHLGARDCPPELARRILFEGALVGLSTHGARQVVQAGEVPVDYLGFGPIHATATKGYAQGLGAEAAWVASTATEKPLFPIGGIDRMNAGELAPIGRAAVSIAILGAEDPACEARAIRNQLTAPSESPLDGIDS